MDNKLTGITCNDTDSSKNSDNSNSNSNTNNISQLLHDFPIKTVQYFFFSHHIRAMLLPWPVLATRLTAMTCKNRGNLGSAGVIGEAIQGYPRQTAYPSTRKYTTEKFNMAFLFEKGSFFKGKKVLFVNRYLSRAMLIFGGLIPC